MENPLKGIATKSDMWIRLSSILRLLDIGVGCCDGNWFRLRRCQDSEEELVANPSGLVEWVPACHINYLAVQGAK
jgi:hypothetical protein